MLGNIFQENREAKGVTQSEAAAATRLKVQHIEALEAENFSIIAASAYAKGFIKLYAEFLEIDPAPLLADYEENFMPKSRQPLLSEDEPRHRHQHQHSSDQNDPDGKTFSLPSLPSFRNIEWPFTFSKKVAGTLAGSVVGLLILILLISSMTRGKQGDEVRVADETVQSQQPVDVTLFRTHVLMRNPPAPFIDEFITP